MHPSPLLEPLRDRLIIRAVARETGVPLARLGRGGLTVVTRGVRVLNPLTSLEGRAAAFPAAMPAEGHAYSHFTAAQLWGLTATRTRGPRGP